MHFQRQQLQKLVSCYREDRFPCCAEETCRGLLSLNTLPSIRCVTLPGSLACPGWQACSSKAGGRHRPTSTQPGALAGSVPSRSPGREGAKVTSSGTGCRPHDEAASESEP